MNETLGDHDAAQAADAANAAQATEAAETASTIEALTTLPGVTPGPDNALISFIDPAGVPVAITVLAIAWVTARLWRSLSTRLSERFGKHRLLVKQTGTLVTFAIYILATVLAASSVFALSAQALFALSGAIAVILGFAFKDTASSIFASVSLLIARPFQVGDRVSFAGYYGEIKEIGLRSVQMVTLDDNLVTIPSHRFLTDAVANANAGELDCMVVMPFWVSPKAPLARAKEIVKDAVLASPYLYLGKPFTMLTGCQLSDDGRLTLSLTAKAYVYDARYEKAFSSDVYERALGQFQAEDIPLPGS